MLLTRLRPRLLAELAGTAMLLCAVIGSGIMAERLSAGNAAVALLANTAATVLALYVLIEVLAPVSGAHFNPAVTLVMAQRGELAGGWAAAGLYVAAQLAGAVLGAWLAHAMFELPLLQSSTRLRAGPGQWLAEAVATAGLVFVILRAPRGKASMLVAAFIGAAYWFTASTSFANPAAVLGRLGSDTFAGIAPASAIPFVIAELAGAAAGAWLATRLHPGHAMDTVTIFHNPNCGTSRNTLAMIRNAGIEPVVVEYLKTPPAREELRALIARMGIPVRDAMRQKESLYTELRLDDPARTDDELLDAMMVHPILINRPIVVTPLGVRLCRPSEAVLDLLPSAQRGAFTKEDGEQVVDAQGRRVS